MQLLCVDISVFCKKPIENNKNGIIILQILTTIYQKDFNLLNRSLSLIFLCYVSIIPLSFFDFSFVVSCRFLLLPHKITQNSNLFIVMFIKVETIPISEPNLEKVVVKAFFRYANFFGCFLQRVFFMLQRLINGPWVILSPLNNFLNYMPDSPLLSPSTLPPFPLIVFILALFIMLVFDVSHSSLRIHKSVDI